MRVTTDMSVRLLSSALQRQQHTLYRTRQEMASGRRVNLASDDPGAYESIRNLRTDLSQLQQFERNATMAKHYLATADQGIYAAINTLHRINELAVSGTDSTREGGTRTAMAEEVNQLLESVLAIANSSEGGRYTFAGLRTDVAPYSRVDDPDTGRIIAIEYVGSEESRQIKIGPELYSTTGIPGTSAAGEGGLFQTATRDLFQDIIDLRDALEAGSDADAVTAIQTRLQGDLDHLISQASLNGARHEQVVAHGAYIKAMQSTNLQSLESMESVDMAEASMRLAQAEHAYNAALHSTSNLLQQASLLHYI